MQRQTQVAQCRAVPNAVGVIERIGAYASGIRMVVVRVGGEASSQARLVERCLFREQGVNFVSSHRDGTGGAVQIILEIQVGL